MKEAILVIDVQNALTKNLDPHIMDTLNNINLVIKDAENSEQVFYLRHLEVGSEFDPKEKSSELSEFLHIRNDQIIEKYHHSAFYKTDLHDKLQAAAIGRVVIVGFQTEYCIDATVKTAHFLGYETIVLSDAHNTFDSEIEKEILCYHYNKQFNLYATVVDTSTYLNRHK